MICKICKKEIEPYSTEIGFIVCDNCMENVNVDKLNHMFKTNFGNSYGRESKK